MATQTNHPAETELHEASYGSDAIPAVAGPEVDSSPSNPHRLRQLYEYMLKCTLVRARMSELKAKGRLSEQAERPFGTVATGVGTMIELRPGDAIAAQDSVIVPVMRHVPMEHLFGALYGFESEYHTARPHLASKGIHVIPRTSSVAATFDVAAGMALAARRQSRRDVVIVHATDGFGALGYWHEAAALASQERLPIVFVIENDAAVCANLEDSTFRDRAESYGMPGITVAAGDVVAVWRVTQESIYRARGGAGPTLIDCRVGCANRSDGKAWSDTAEVALAHMQHYLQKRAFWDPEWKRGMEVQTSEQIRTAVEFAEKVRCAQ